MGKKIQCLGHYTMDGVLLGKGNFARVELATHKIVEVKVAIKVIDTRKIKDEYVRSNLHREAGIMAKLRHPNIIRLYETLKATTLYCLVTEYCSGGELKSHIKSQENQRLTEKEARPFVRQLVSAIEYLHERGVVHRDLKMENILLDAKKKNVKLIDFGLSNVYREDDPLRTHCGSPEYAAPELFVLGKTYGPEIDIWSLGIIMYAMVLGHLPFSTPYKDEYQRQRMLQNIQKGLSGYHDREMQILTKECRTFVHQLVEPNPELRISLTDIVRHPWVTRHGRLPFCSYLPPAKDKTIRHQAVMELSIMMGLKRKDVEETVREHKADELSCMYNMIIDKKQRDKGVFDKDHTTPRRTKRTSRSQSKDEEKIGTPDSCHGIRTKGGVPKKVLRAKAGMGSKARPKNRHIRLPSEDELHMERSSLLHPHDALHDDHLPHKPQHLGIPAAHYGAAVDSSKDPGLPNGPSRIPMSQRRQPPPKLNLTLDLSVVNSSALPPATVKRKGQLVDEHKDSPAASSCALGIAASSGVPPKLSPDKESTGKEKKSGASKIPVLSPKEKSFSPARSIAVMAAETFARPLRPSTLQYALKAKFARTLSTSDTSGTVSRHTAQLISKFIAQTTSSPVKSSDSDGEKQLLAPKATPEDSVIDSYSTSSEEGGFHLSCPSASMQPEMLKSSDEESVSSPTLMCPREPPRGCMSTTALEPLVLKPQAKSTGSAPQVPTMSASHQRMLQARHSNVYMDSGASGVSQSSTYSSHLPPYPLGSGSSLPSSSQASLKPQGLFAASEQQDSNACLLTEHAGASASNTFAAAVCCGREDSSNACLSLSFSQSDPPPLNPPAPSQSCYICGLSPGSPTYYESHSKFCHAGAHALDVFVSPDEVPSPMHGTLWRPVASIMSCESPTLGGSPSSPLLPLRSFRQDDCLDYDAEDEGCGAPFPRPPVCPSPPHIARRATAPRPLHVHTQQPQSRSSKPTSNTSNPRDASKRFDAFHLHDSSSTSSSIDTSCDHVFISQPSATVHPLCRQAEPSLPPPPSYESTLADNPVTSDPKQAQCIQSRLPRPAGRLGKIPVLQRLRDRSSSHSSERGNDRRKDGNSNGNGNDRTLLLESEGTPEHKSCSTPDTKQRAHSWRHGLSHWLHGRKSKTVNNNVARNNVPANGNSSCTVINNTNAKNGRQNSEETPPLKMSNSVSNKSDVISREDTFPETEIAWNADKHNSLPARHAPSQPGMGHMLDGPNIWGDDHCKTRSARLSWTACHDCSQVDPSSDEAVVDQPLPGGTILQNHLHSSSHLHP